MIIVEDKNFLEHHMVHDVENAVMFSKFPWHFMKNTISYEDKSMPKLEMFSDRYQFTHLLYADEKPQSEYFEDCYQILKMFLNKNEVEYKSLIRMKFNLVTGSNKDMFMPPHVDLSYDHKVFLYYVNNCSGDTAFFDKNYQIIERISPEQGKGIIFDGTTLHSNALPKEGEFRCVLNAAFI